MAFSPSDFDKIWGSTSPLTPYEFTESQYKEGWNWIGSTPPARQMWDSYMKLADQKLNYLYHHESVPIGHEYFTFNPNIPQGSLPLFGGEYSRETYSLLWEWVQEQTGYLKTEAEWQTLSTANGGNVPYYSDGDGSTTFRVPSLKCWIKGANGTTTEVGSYLAAGLPNITGDYGSGLVPMGGQTNIGNGAVRAIYDQQNANGASGANGWFSWTFDASRSNSIYGNSTTVQPPSIVGMWLVKAYGTIEDTGTIDEQQYIDDRMVALKQTIDDEVAAEYLSLNGGDMNANAEIRCASLKATKVLGVEYDAGNLYIRNPSLTRGASPSGNEQTGSLSFKTYANLENKNLQSIKGNLYATNITTLDIAVFGNASSTIERLVVVSTNADGSGCDFYSYPDNRFNLGISNARWKQVYAASGTINTSDERVKDNITAIPNDVLDAWGEVNWYQYQFKDAIAEKGENARIHCGTIAQRIKSAFESHGLDAFRYGLLCYDEWEEEKAEYDKDGNLTNHPHEAGNRYSLRYEEALCIEAAYQRRRADRLEARIEALERVINHE